MEMAIDGMESSRDGLIPIISRDVHGLVRIALLNEVRFNDRKDIAHRNFAVGGIVGAFEDLLSLHLESEDKRSSVGIDTDIGDVARVVRGLQLCSNR